MKKSISVFTKDKYLFQKIYLEHAFSARKRSAAARCIIEVFVLQNDLQNLFCGVFLAADLSCILWAEECALSAKITFFKRIWTLFFAFSASCTLIFIKKHLSCGALAFGIVAPLTPKIASLEENGCAYSRPVHVGGALNIKDRGFRVLHSCHLRLPRRYDRRRSRRSRSSDRRQARRSHRDG